MSRLLVTSRIAPPATHRKHPAWRSFHALAAMSGRDMLRNPLTGFSMIVLAGIGLFIYVGMWLAFCVLDAPCSVDPLRVNLGPATTHGLTALAFVGTTVPLVGMREQGLLRLFGTTPLRRSMFLLAQLPTRLVAAFAIISVALGVAVARNYLESSALPALAVTFTVGTGMLFAFALLLAARSHHAESTQQGVVMLTILLLWTSGGLLPPELVPDFLQFILNCIPTTWFAAAVGAGMTGSTPFLPVSGLWMLMIAVTVVAASSAFRIFVWDEPGREPERLRDGSTAVISEQKGR